MKKLTLPIIVAILFLYSDRALGCSCYSPWMDAPKDSEEQFRSKVEGALNSAAFVFTAEVVEFEQPDPNVANTENPFEELTKLKIRFKIENIWKGELTDEIIMPALSGKLSNGHYWQTGCSYYFEEGKKYLIYAAGPKDKLRVHLCSRTRLLEGAEKEVGILHGLKRKDEKAQVLSKP